MDKTTKQKLMDARQRILQSNQNWSCDKAEWMAKQILGIIRR
jgi:hypothetical protein